MRECFFSFLVLIALCGCDRTTATSPPPTTEDVPTKYAADLSIVTPLLPRRSTHLAVDSNSGNLYFVQESEAGDDVLFIAGPSDVPRATSLSSANILAAAGAESSDRGNIRSIAVGPGGEVYFFFLGGGKKNTIGCFG